MFDSNKRKYPRANYPCKLTMWMGDGISEIIMANTSNIGLGGLCVYLNQGVYLGTKVDVQLNFTDQSTPFKCKGMVVRSFPESDKFYETAIQFEPLSELKAAFLNGKISELIDRDKKGKN